MWQHLLPATCLWKINVKLSEKLRAPILQDSFSFFWKYVISYPLLADEAQKQDNTSKPGGEGALAKVSFSPIPFHLVIIVTNRPFSRVPTTLFLYVQCSEKSMICRGDMRVWGRSRYIVFMFVYWYFVQWLWMMLLACGLFYCCGIWCGV